MLSMRKLERINCVESKAAIKNVYVLTLSSPDAVCASLFFCCVKCVGAI